jgi:hypothetical protein
LPGAVGGFGPLHQEEQIVGFGGRFPLDEHVVLLRLRRGPEVEQGHTGPDRGGQEEGQQNDEENGTTRHG